MAFNFTDFYILYPGHPRFNDTQIIEDDIVKVILQKWEMILFTNKGDVFCEPNMGGDLELLLHETRLSADTIEGNLREQITTYISELNSITYTLSVNFFEDPDRYQEYMEIYFQIADYQVYAVVA